MRTIKGVSFALALKASDTISAVKRKLEKAEGTPIEEQVILYFLT